MLKFQKILTNATSDGINVEKRTDIQQHQSAFSYLLNCYFLCSNHFGHSQTAFYCRLQGQFPLNFCRPICMFYRHRTWDCLRCHI